MTALENLIYGNRGTLEGMRTTKEYANLLAIVIDRDKKMRDLLASSPDLLTHYDDTITSLDYANSQLAIDHLLEGLRFGILLGIDITKEPESYKLSET